MGCLIILGAIVLLLVLPAQFGQRVKSLRDADKNQKGCEVLSESVKSKPCPRFPLRTWSCLIGTSRTATECTPGSPRQPPPKIVNAPLRHYPAGWHVAKTGYTSLAIAAHPSSLYRVCASRYNGRQTDRFTATTSAAITMVDSSSKSQLPESVAELICAPRPERLQRLAPSSGNTRPRCWRSTRRPKPSPCPSPGTEKCPGRITVRQRSPCSESETHPPLRANRWEWPWRPQLR